MEGAEGLFLKADNAIKVSRADAWSASEPEFRESVLPRECQHVANFLPQWIAGKTKCLGSGKVREESCQIAEMPRLARRSSINAPARQTPGSNHQNFAACRWRLRTEACQGSSRNPSRVSSRISK